MLKNAIIFSFFIGANSFAAESSATSNKFTLKDAEQITPLYSVPEGIVFNILLRDKSVFIEIPQGVSKFDVKIVNVQGQTFFQKKDLNLVISNHLNIDQSGQFDSGYYLLQLKSEEFQHSQKIWIEGKR